MDWVPLFYKFRWTRRLIFNPAGPRSLQAWPRREINASLLIYSSSQTAWPARIETKTPTVTAIYVNCQTPQFCTAATSTGDHRTSRARTKRLVAVMWLGRSQTLSRSRTRMRGGRELTNTS